MTCNRNTLLPLFLLAGCTATSGGSDPSNTSSSSGGQGTTSSGTTSAISGASSGASSTTVSTGGGSSSGGVACTATDAAFPLTDGRVNLGNILVDANGGLTMLVLDDWTDPSLATENPSYLAELPPGSSTWALSRFDTHTGATRHGGALPLLRVTSDGVLHALHRITYLGQMVYGRRPSSGAWTFTVVDTIANGQFYDAELLVNGTQTSAVYTKVDQTTPGFDGDILLADFPGAPRAVVTAGSSRSFNAVRENNGNVLLFIPTDIFSTTAPWDLVRIPPGGAPTTSPNVFQGSLAAAAVAPDGRVHVALRPSGGNGLRLAVLQGNVLVEAVDLDASTLIAAAEIHFGANGSRHVVLYSGPNVRVATQTGGTGAFVVRDLAQINGSFKTRASAVANGRVHVVMRVDDQVHHISGCL